MDVKDPGGCYFGREMRMKEREDAHMRNRERSGGEGSGGEGPLCVLSGYCPMQCSVDG